MILPDNETRVDLLNNEAIAATIIALLRAQRGYPVTVGVHGDWGAGKSSILEMIEAGLSDSGDVLCLKFNSWRFQGFEDAKIALIEGVVTGLLEKRPALTRATEGVKDLFRRIDWLKVAKHAGGLAFTAFTGVPTPDQISAITSGLQHILADPAKFATKENITAAIDGVKSVIKPADAKNVPEEIAEFRKAFDKLLKDAGIKQLVVLVDDLDRCLPDTAIETLEAIRLFVFTAGTAFVVAADEAMIEYSVRKHFPDLPETTGPRDYARNYLEKLIQIPFRIPALGETETRILQLMLNFLTGDRWTIQFRPRPPRFAKIVPQADLIAPPFTGVSLFSGGLDSLIGAIDQLEAKRIPLLVSHAGEPAVSKAQDDCFGQLKKHYTPLPFERLRTWMAFPKQLVRNVGAEDSTRGRSFLFFALGVFAGTGLRTNFVMQAPENGLIALNVPLDTLRLGALSTRTTHPFYIARWNELLGLLGIPGRVENPYWDKTKGEMVRGCSNLALLKQLVPETLSCASPTKGRWQGHGTQHCGYCLPCLIRRASLASITDSTTYTVPNLRARVWDPQTATGEQIRSFQYAVDRLGARPGIEKLLIHKPGPLNDNPAALGDLAAVYKRGLEEVGSLLTGVRTRPS